MSRVSCPHEPEIQDAVTAGRWPGRALDSVLDRADAELRAHASTCVVCSDLAMIATLYREDAALAFEEARVPSAGLVWWKSELRSRREAVRAAARPISVVTGIAAACAVGIFAAALKSLFGNLNLTAVSTFLLGQPLLLWIVLGAILALTPLALYFVYSDE